MDHQINEVLDHFLGKLMLTQSTRPQDKNSIPIDAPQDFWE